MEETKVNEEVRRELAKKYPRSSLFVDPVAIYGFLTIWCIVGWFLAGLKILLHVGSGQAIAGSWIFSFVSCVVLTAYWGTLTSRHARRQRKLHIREK